MAADAARGRVVAVDVAKADGSPLDAVAGTEAVQVPALDLG